MYCNLIRVFFYYIQLYVCILINDYYKNLLQYFVYNKLYIINYILGI